MKIGLIIKSLALLIFFQNCARLPMGLEGNSDSASLTTNNDPVYSPYALLTGEQIFKGMLNLTGTAPTGAVNNEYKSRENAFSLNADLKNITSPMMIAITSLGGEVCNTLLASEISKSTSDRAFFSEVDFTKDVSNVNTDQFDFVIHSLARTFWGRNETEEERNLLLNGKSEFLATLEASKATQATSTRDLMLFTCSAMLSSVDAFTY
jgi:hypothetical protein